VVFELSEQKLGSFKAKDIVSVPQQNASNVMMFKMEGVDVEFDMRFKMYSKPEWVRDEGTGKLRIQGMNITMELTPSA
jgi:hypothetical protein